MRHFLSITDVSADDVRDILHVAKRIKSQQARGARVSALKNKTLIMLFEKPSLRTRLSFEIGMTQLGGHALYLGPSEVGLGKRESVEDAAHVMSRMGDIIMARVFSHESVTIMAKHSRVPVINALSDREHPCQALADVLTMWEHKRILAGLRVAFIGDGENNVTHSLALISGLLGIHYVVASPHKYRMRPDITQEARKLAKKSKGSITEVVDPREAVQNADIVYTDTWVSMGSEVEREKRLKVFRPFRVTKELMKFAKRGALFMHDLPAYRGNEVEADVIDGPQSIIFDQAENRLHAQKALMVWLSKKARQTR